MSAGLTDIAEETLNGGFPNQGVKLVPLQLFVGILYSVIRPLRSI
jgi:hypothetical protein